MKQDDHGDRMKGYEAVAEARLDPSLPIYARIDGRAFSTFTRGMAKPFDVALSDAMIAATSILVERTHARVGYTQSDEISLLFLANEGAELLFGGRVQKLASVLAGLTTAAFTAHLGCKPAFTAWRLPHFDCRVCNLPTREEAANMLVWRFKDASKNAIQSAAHSRFGHAALHGKSCGAMLDMLTNVGVDRDSGYARAFWRGTFVRRQTVMRPLTFDELSRIPEAHRPAGDVERSVTVTEHIDLIACRNREAFLFDNAAAETGIS